MKQQLLSVQEFLTKNERVLLPVFLLLGFIVDSFTLRRVDLLPETILVYAYLALSAWAILIMHLIQSGVFKGPMAEKIEPIVPLVLTYAFGSLFSAFAVFYAKSALISDSWPFIAVLAGVVVGLEVFRQYRTQLVFNLSLFFLAVFSFSVFSVPLWTGKLGTDIFFLSTLTAVGIFVLFCIALYAAGKRILKENIRGIAISVGSIVTAMVVFYSANLLPPIPLALKDIGVYHRVTREDANYRLHGEAASFVDRIFGITIHWVKDKPIYVFSSVFTPVAISTNVVHRWEYWSEEENDWMLSNDVSFPAEGGREKGYRGFSWKKSVFPGKWRVTVETPDGLKIGRIEFTIEDVSTPPPLEESIR